MTDLHFQLQDNFLRAYDADNIEVGHIEFALNDGVCTILHTITEEAFRGQSVAHHLMQEMMLLVEKSGWKVHSECNYATTYLKRVNYPL